MAMRWRAVLLLATACEARLGPGGGDTQDAGAADAMAAPDVSIDAPIDARSCAGGDMAASAPDGSCFVLVTSPLTYLEAKAACEAMSAHLAYLKTAALDAFAQTFVGARNVFVGGSDRVTEGTFLWEDGTPFSYTNWGAGEPNNGGPTYEEDCVIIAGTRDSLWDDRPCDASQVASSGRFAYLCQY
jgi:hypothetical protein